MAIQAFSGDTFDGHTLLPALEQLRKQYHLDKLVFVADSGMFNEDNLQQLESQNFDYIVGARIKNVGQSLTDKILDKSQYKALNKHIKVACFRLYALNTKVVPWSSHTVRKEQKKTVATEKKG